MFPFGVSDDCIDLLSKSLAFNPNKRIDILGSLAHPYVAQFHEEGIEDEIVCTNEVVIPINDNKKLNVQAYINEIYTNIIHVKQEESKERRKEKKEKRSSKKKEKKEKISTSKLKKSSREEEKKKVKK